MATALRTERSECVAAKRPNEEGGPQGEPQDAPSKPLLHRIER